MPKMKTLGRALLWIATLIAAADCPAADVSALESCEAHLATERTPPDSNHESGLQLHQQRQSPCAMTDGRRVRQSRARWGYSLDDWLATALDCVHWLSNMLGSSNFAALMTAVASCLIGLCLTRPGIGQDGLWWSDLPAPPSESVAFRDLDALAMVPPRENAIFQPPPPSDETRYLPEGNGWIVVSDPRQYPRIPALDCDIPGSIFNTWRANLFGIDVPDEWDFYNLISTDRPDFTDATFSVGTGVTIIETGYTFRKAFDQAANLEQSRRSLPEALVRYGLTDEF